MGVGFTIRGKVKGYTFGKIPHDKIFKKILFFLMSEDSLIQGFKNESEIIDGKLRVYLYPAESPLMLHSDGEYMYAEARTSSAGPGYHAYAVDWVLRCGEFAGISWIINESSPNYGDDTLYVKSMDYSDITFTMSAWLQNVFIVLKEKFTVYGHVGGFSLSLPPDITPADTSKIWYPLGYFKQSYAADYNLTQPTEEELINNPINAMVFPWWNSERDAQFYLNMALVLMWYYCPWHIPLTQDEKIVYHKINTCLNLAYSLDSNLAYPWAEWKEVLQFMEDSEAVSRLESIANVQQANREPTIGFRRGIVSHRLEKHWRIHVPGQMHYSKDEDGESFWTSTRTVRISSLYINYDNNIPVPKGMLINLDLSDGFSEFSQLRHKGLYAVVKSSVKQSEEGMLLHNILCKVACDGNVAVMSIYYLNREDLSWAMQVLLSISNEMAIQNTSLS